MDEKIKFAQTTSHSTENNFMKNAKVEKVLAVDEEIIPLKVFYFLIIYLSIQKGKGQYFCLYHIGQSINQSLSSVFPPGEGGIELIAPLLNKKKLPKFACSCCK